MGVKRIYLAGPEVFLDDAVEMGRRKKDLCRAYGFVGLYPFDNEVVPASPSDRLDRLIFSANASMIAEADLAIVNLTPFRGPSADVGSVFELGMAFGQGKPVFGYSNVVEVYLDRVSASGPVTEDRKGVHRDGFGMSIENFGNADNLMIDGCLAAQGRFLVRNAVPVAARFRDLDGFETCLRAASEFYAAGTVSERFRA